NPPSTSASLASRENTGPQPRALSIPRGCGRAVIALAGADDQAFARGLHFNGTVGAHGRRVRRRIGDEILAAQLGADVEKRLRQVVDAIGKERVAAGLVG